MRTQTQTKVAIQSIYYAQRDQWKNNFVCNNPPFKRPLARQCRSGKCSRWLKTDSFVLFNLCKTQLQQKPSTDTIVSTTKCKPEFVGTTLCHASWTLSHKGAVREGGRLQIWIVPGLILNVWGQSVCIDLRRQEVWGTCGRRLLVGGPSRLLTSAFGDSGHVIQHFANWNATLVY